MPISTTSKKRSHSIGRSDQQHAYQSSLAIPNTNQNSSQKNVLSRPKLLQYIEDNIIGKDHIFQGPWGLRRSRMIIEFRNMEFICFCLFVSSDLLRLYSIRSTGTIY